MKRLLLAPLLIFLLSSCAEPKQKQINSRAAKECDYIDIRDSYSESMKWVRCVKGKGYKKFK
tara:strand:- start:40 stop:225 length:186 start_codon:yes stop_codon:yes gene_type:complete